MNYGEQQTNHTHEPHSQTDDSYFCKCGCKIELSGNEWIKILEQL